MTLRFWRGSAVLIGLALGQLAGWSSAEARRGGWGVGNGGDALRLAVAKAREHAAYITLRLPERALVGASSNVRAWIIEHQAELAADIMTTKHEWTLDAKPTCAWTTQERSAELNLSYPTCRDGLDSFDEAGQLLIHESVHHFGIGDEGFADAVALAIYDAWRSGATDWGRISSSGAPSERSQHTAVWTGEGMIVFGGNDGNGNALSTGSYYNPKTDQWDVISSNGAPARYGHHAIWAEGVEKMIVWGGYVVRGSSKVWQNNGAIYDPKADSWTELKTPYGSSELPDLAIDERQIQSAVWTGEDLIVYGGALQNGALTGGIYNPKTNQWRAIVASGAPIRIAGHTAVWTGTEMIVWGGMDAARNRSNHGAAYNLARNTWRTISGANAPMEREGHTAVFTGSKMIIFGGFESLNAMNGSGGVYDVETDSWTAIATEAVQARLNHSAVWTGSEMLVFGGKSKRLKTYYSAVSAYNPSNNSWRVVEAPNAPLARMQHSVVWTGNSMLMWGGWLERGMSTATGAQFYP